MSEILTKEDIRKEENIVYKRGQLQHCERRRKA